MKSRHFYRFALFLLDSEMIKMTLQMNTATAKGTFQWKKKSAFRKLGKSMAFASTC